jgi:hypothetical protein
MYRWILSYRIVYYSIEMKSFIQSLIARVSSSVKAQTTAAAAPVLGRWGIQYDKRIIDRKIIQANEDHCGCCVVAEIPKKDDAAAATMKKSVVRYEKREEYLVPYVM